MKRTLLYLLAVLLSVIAGVQTAWGQKITLYMGGKQSHEYDISQLDSIVFSDAPATVDPRPRGRLKKAIPLSMPMETLMASIRFPESMKHRF